MEESSFYNYEELKGIGLKNFGKDVLISRNVKIYGSAYIEIGNNVRIDDFCILSGSIKLGSHIHIGAATHLFAGDAAIEIEDFSCLSGRCAVYAVTDDYSGETLTNSVICNKFKNVYKKKVLIKKHSLIGTGSTILTGVTVEEGCSFGAMSLIKKSTKPWKVYAGIPAKVIKDRKKDLLNLEESFLKEWEKQNG